MTALYALIHFFLRTSSTRALAPARLPITMERSGRIARRQARGQALTLVALILPLLVMLAMTAIEIHTRLLEVAELEDALRQATRSSVQLLDYAAFAENGQRVDVARVRAVARQTFATNLHGVRGLDEPVEALVDRVAWEIYPNGGTCTFPNEDRAPVTLATPMVCASVRPKLTGLLGWGSYQPQINAAETLDRIE